MNYCYVEFLSKRAEALDRTVELFKMLKDSKEAGEEFNANLFSETERAYFWNPSEREMKEWNDEWFATPIEIRHSREMLKPQWHLESMLDALSTGDYELIAIQNENGQCKLTFNPHGYPYGGTGCMVAFLESLGNIIIGIEDGTGYEKHTQRTSFWTSRRKQ